MCGDCLLQGGHAEHQVKALKQVEEDLKVTVQMLLGKAEDKLKDGERILKEFEKIDSFMAVSKNVYVEEKHHSLSAGDLSR